MGVQEASEKQEISYHVKYKQGYISRTDLLAIIKGHDILMIEDIISSMS